VLALCKKRAESTAYHQLYCSYSSRPASKNSAMAPEHHNPQAGAGRQLPKKEQDMFRTLQKHYDMKQYKKALKQADAILKKFPRHGETLAMKGLTFSSMGKGEEAHACVKEGLMNDMT
jgi:outer membrane protein assembly factor BamD (BamD/ComL family)